MDSRWGLTSELHQAGCVCHLCHFPAMMPRPQSPPPTWAVGGHCCMGLPTLRLIGSLLPDVPHLCLSASPGYHKDHVLRMAPDTES